MFKQLSEFKTFLILPCLLLLFISSGNSAEIFKWVDENGKTHYSDKKPDAEKLKVDKLKIKSSPKTVVTKNSAIERWKKQELELQQEQVQKNRTKKSHRVQKYKKGWGGDEPETDATRCALARDIISGKAKLRNGLEVDANDKKLARDEIKRFCR